MKRPLSLVATLLASLTGCGGPPIVTPIEDEPICPDFEVGVTKTKMHGGLRKPIYVEVLDDGDVIAKITLFGRNSDKAKKTPVVLTNQDDVLAVHWRQCQNEHAPSPLTDVKVKHVIKYECGPTEFYASDTLSTLEGQVDTMTLHVPPPPDARCWGDGDDAAEQDGEPGDADAGVLTDAGADDPAGAGGADVEDEDAGTGGAGSTDAAAPEGSASAAPAVEPPDPPQPAVPKPKQPKPPPPPVAPAPPPAAPPPAAPPASPPTP